MRHTAGLTLLLLTLGLLASACGQRSEPTGELTQPYPVTVQGAGEQPVEVAASPQRIVALDAGSAELVDALGAGDRLVGAPPGVKLASKPRLPEVVRQNGQIDVARIVKLEPDLVIVTPDTDPVDVSQIERRTNATVYVQPSRTIDDVERAIIELGFVLGQPVEARQLAGSIERSLAETADRIADVTPATVFVDLGDFVTVSNRTLLGDIVARAKGTNIAADHSGFAPYPVADLRKADPDVYLTTSDSGATEDTLRADPRTRKLAAVRDGRVVVVPVDLVTRPGPRVAQALETIASALHPDAFR